MTRYNGRNDIDTELLHKYETVQIVIGIDTEVPHKYKQYKCHRNRAFPPHADRVLARFAPRALHMIGVPVPHGAGLIPRQQKSRIKK